MKRRFIAATLAMLISANFLACGGSKKEEKDTKEKTSTSEEEKNKSEGKVVSIASIREKYASSEEASYTEAKYNLDKTHVFKFEIEEEVAKKFEENLSDIYTVALDAAGTQIVDAQISIDSESGDLKVKPPKAGVFADNDDQLKNNSEIIVEDFDATTEREFDYEWGNANNYYLIKKVDTKTGEKLSKPEITIFTVKSEIGAPTIKYGVNKDGLVEFSWNEIEGADSYTVCEVYRDNSDKGNSYRLKELVKTKKNKFSDFPGNILDMGDEVIQTNGVFKLENKDADGEMKENTAREYCVIATAGEKKSSISNILSTKEAASRAIVELDHERNMKLEENLPKIDPDKERTPQSIERFKQTPTHYYVKMGDGKSVLAPVDYDTKYLEFREHEKYGMLAEARYKVRGTSLVRLEIFFVDDKSEETKDLVLKAIKEIQERQENVAEQALNSNVDVDIETTPPSDMEETEADTNEQVDENK
ncbi:MAG: hypothetical protein ACRDCW_11210, partial [Sarcina sp.]